MGRLRWARGLLLAGLLGSCVLLVRLAGAWPDALEDARGGEARFGDLGLFLVGLATAVVLAFLVGLAVAAAGAMSDPPRRTMGRVMAALAAALGVYLPTAGVGPSQGSMAAGALLALYGVSLWLALRPGAAGSAVEGA